MTSLRALSREWGWTHHATWGSAAWCSPPLLFQLSGYSLKPKGVFNGALGSQAWLLTAPRWKASDTALSPPCYTLPWLSKLLWDFECSYGSACYRAMSSLSLVIGIPWYHITACAHCKIGICQQINWAHSFFKCMATNASLIQFLSGFWFLTCTSEGSHQQCYVDSDTSLKSPNHLRYRFLHAKWWIADAKVNF